MDIICIEDDEDFVESRPTPVCVTPPDEEDDDVEMVWVTPNSFPKPLDDYRLISRQLDLLMLINRRERSGLYIPMEYNLFYDMSKQLDPKVEDKIIFLVWKRISKRRILKIMNDLNATNKSLLEKNTSMDVESENEGFVSIELDDEDSDFDIQILNRPSTSCVLDIKKSAKNGRKITAQVDLTEEKYEQTGNKENRVFTSSTQEKNPEKNFDKRLGEQDSCAKSKLEKCPTVTPIENKIPNANQKKRKSKEKLDTSVSKYKKLSKKEYKSFMAEQKKLRLLENQRMSVKVLEKVNKRLIDLSRK